MMKVIMMAQYAIPRVIQIIVQIRYNHNNSDGRWAYGIREFVKNR